ncbi:dihydroorotate dehydrogenase (quinone) [Thermocladium modestius]|uniref:Dihydroorotate dehydrogenase (Quinone) n=1 Tax=Thermocladium modestius TaxID=62609 RepID=A0A830GU12_9CREN|nr:dihydroorotate oxidase [Thermocladium modestius]GGP21292.1 dihydroorotate dehydrogenase (quinone) [Thermocladium modestius]
MNLRTLINKLPPEATYETSHLLLRLPILPRLLKALGPRRPVPARLNHKTIDGPIGIGAGIDKDGLLMDLAAAMPVGFHVVGSITPSPREGNPRPRFLKYPELGAMINAMGLPSRGAGAALRIVKSKCPSWPNSKLLIVSAAGFTVEEVVRTARAASAIKCVDYVELNVSSPTYRGLWLEGDGLRRLLGEAERLDKPALIKVPLLRNIDAERRLISELAASGLGLTIANTLPITAPLPRGYGGLSGAPINELVVSLIRIARRVGHRGLIIGTGGFLDGASVMAGLRAGADLVGIVTAFAMEGPAAVYRITAELRRYVGKPNVSSPP